MPRNTQVLLDYRNRHRGETIIICGCGVSLGELPPDYPGITIGVNDIGRYLDPTYLVVLNPANQFSHERFRYVTESRAGALFTHLNLHIAHPNIVRFRLGQRGGTDLTDDGSLPYTRNSTYVALCLAIFMGAKRIGVIGVDFTDDHFFGTTGPHPLQGEIGTINKEFTALARMAEKRDVNIVNLSRNSRITAFRKTDLKEFLSTVLPVRSALQPHSIEGRKVFFVNYRFKTCGDIFTTGLRHAADALRLSHMDADWDDPALARKVTSFTPELLFVVHGRSFLQRWGSRIRHPNSAVWLLDEPYEVDNTAIYSPRFHTVFVNDYATLERHHNIYYLPVAYDPVLHFDPHQPREHAVGFIGGYSPQREKFLLALLEVGRLSYVVGGPWRSPRLRAMVLADRLSPEESARLYQRTRIVINVFRSKHHYNKNGVRALSLNPRIYEALACGAAVITEPREELMQLFPSLPCFTNPEQLLIQVETLLGDEATRLEVINRNMKTLTDHTYQNRLQRVLETCMPQTKETCAITDAEDIAPLLPPPSQTNSLPSGWERVGAAMNTVSDNRFIFTMKTDERPGAECGIASNASFTDVELSFEVKLAPDTCFVAKIHQADQMDQTTNSYHLMCRSTRQGYSYLGMHHRILTRLTLMPEKWYRVTMRYRRGKLEAEIDGRQLYSRTASELPAGFCFLGVKGGAVEVRALSLRAAPLLIQPPPQVATPPAFDILQDFGEAFVPQVSIVTTIYDRTTCLEQCLESVSQLQYRNFEHIIVADHPPPSVVKRIQEIVAQDGSRRIKFMNLRRRHNDWGITPAAAGLSVARGDYLCFLSDDNGYTPEHFNALVQILDRTPNIGFAYSSCKYAGRMVLRGPVPRPGAIDLGQPLFRRELFQLYLGGGLPFDMMAWDWHMIKAFMDRGVRWRHVNRETFLFRLHAYLPTAETGT